MEKIFTNEQIIYKEIIWPLYIKLENKEFITDRFGIKTLELINFNSSLLNPNQPNLKFGTIKETSMKYVKKELEWYNSQDLLIQEIGKYAQLWTKIASTDNKINSNYGYLIYSKENNYQYDNVIKELLNNPESRRAVMIYNRPSIWSDWNYKGMNDFICTINTQHFIRNNKLISIVNMRSNDFIYGFFNDFYWQCTIHNKLLAELGSSITNIESEGLYWNAGSMHIYEKHFKLLEKLSTYDIDFEEFFKFLNF